MASLISSKGSASKRCGASHASCSVYRGSAGKCFGEQDFSQFDRRGEDDGIEPFGIEPERLAVHQPQCLVPLEQALIDKEVAPLGRNEGARTGDRTGAAEKS
jgi:hypothetical protein